MRKGTVQGGSTESNRSEKLRALQTTTEQLVRAASRSDVARITVETAREVLDFPLTGIWFYDDATDTLEPAAVTDEGRARLGDPVSFGRGESLSWEAFEAGEIRLYDDVRQAESVYNASTAVRSEINVPIGRHGVLTSATTRRAEFTEDDVDLMRILAANAEAVLDRTERERDVSRYADIVEAANDPIWTVDERGSLTHVNAGTERLSGRNREELLGKRDADVLPADLVDAAADAIETLRETGADSTTAGATVQLPTGETREYRLGVSRLYEDETAVGNVCVAHDVTELLRNEQLLSVFNRVLRHNLRNELNVILGAIDALNPGDDTQESALAESGHRSVQKLLRVTEKIQRFRSVVEPTADRVAVVDLAPIVGRVADRTRESSPSASISTDVPDTLLVKSHVALEYAIEELLQNAVEHTDVDPEISVTVDETDGDETISLRVADNGPGIPDMERKVLETGAETPLSHGSGLGLWMVRWTVNRSGGSVDIDQREPRGTVFVLHLPSANPPDDGSSA